MKTSTTRIPAEPTTVGNVRMKLVSLLIVAVPTVVVPSAPVPFSATNATAARPQHETAATATAQDPVAVEASLGLDRSARRLIQHGLRNEGFDPGTPDGLFGPRTRAAIRRWQDARGTPSTGYLDDATARLLRAAAAPPSPSSPTAVSGANATAESSAAAPQPPSSVATAAPLAAEVAAEPHRATSPAAGRQPPAQVAATSQLPPEIGAVGGPSPPARQLTENRLVGPTPPRRTHPSSS